MKKINLLGGLAAIPMAAVPLTATLTGCSSSKPFIDYSDSNNYIFQRTIANARYDVIFLVGTSNMEPTQSNGVGYDHDKMMTNGWENYATVGSQFADQDSNVYVPLYRQMALYYALDTYKLHNDIINDVATKEPYQDLKTYLDYYFTKVNKDAKRPFVIAGHSQGAAAVQVVLEKYFIKGGHKEYLKNMVAAYAIGYGVSKKWFDGLDKKIDDQEVLHFATKADDTNCLISWNTEGPSKSKGKNFLLPDEENDTYVINPLNWKTDETKAETSLNHGVLIANSTSSNYETPKGYHIATTGEGGEHGENNLMDATIDKKRGSIICTTNTNYISLPDYGYLWGGQSLHIYDGSGYYVNMSENVQTRLNAFIK